MDNAHYILADNGHLEPVSLERWIAWQAVAHRHLGHTTISVDDSSVRVSTVFVGAASSLNEQGRALLFETLVFGELAELEGAVPLPAPSAFSRYADATAAMAGHRKAVDGWVWFFEHTLRETAQVVDDATDLHPIALAACAS